MTNGEGTPSTQSPPSPPDSERPVEDMTVGELVFEVTDQASVLIREEIELAKTEVTEKANSLLRGSIAGLVAGVFALLALALAMHGFAWLLNDLVFNNPWAGFFVEAGIFLLIGIAGGLFAYRSFKRAAPPTPDMAIEEAKEIKAAFEGHNGKEDGP